MAAEIEFKLVITENGEEVYASSIGHRELTNLVINTPDIPDNQGFFKYASQHPAYEVREQAADKQHLPLDQLRQLATDPNLEVRKAAIQQRKLKHSLSLEELKSLISADASLARLIAGSVEDFADVDVSELCTILQHHTDPGVALELVEGYKTPRSVAKAFLKHPDASVAAAAKTALTD